MKNGARKVFSIDRFIATLFWPMDAVIIFQSSPGWKQSLPPGDRTGCRTVIRPDYSDLRMLTQGQADYENSCHWPSSSENVPTKRVPAYTRVIYTPRQRTEVSFCLQIPSSVSHVTNECFKYVKQGI